MSTPQASPARRTGSWKLPLLGLGVVVLLVGTLSVVESQRLEALRCRTGHCELWRGGLLGPRLATRFEAQAVASVELRVGTTKRTSTLGLRLVDGTLVRLAEGAFARAQAPAVQDYFRAGAPGVRSAELLVREPRWSPLFVTVTVLTVLTSAALIAGTLLTLRARRA